MYKTLGINAAISAVLFLSSPIDIYAQSLPQLDNDGNYGWSGQLFWVVVDPDPDGLNCRWSQAVPESWYSPGAAWPTMNIWQWPVVRQFKYGTVLVANQTPAGSVLIDDERDLPWLKVRQGSNDEICLVRANERFILPLTIH